ncbi:hypothetical protein PLICRDRAFT_174599 [Plicaturopsis crispa FD-325 SS-3]|nr:hypothetical protein PLICRDRAFT_174599 [Plicaturopsis crispa FD-325 SS-3]
MSSSSPTKPSTLWKGKAKATDQDYELDPTITYRHLLNPNPSVRDPLRTIALCDSDAFYATCEQVRLKLDPALPLVVLQWEGLIAVNYAARKFGISRMDKIKDAKKRCPELVVVHVATYKEGEKEPGYWDDIDSRTHKVSLDFYRRESVKILKMFKDGLPGAEIEKASIDEAFIDFSRPVRAIILERYPHLAHVPPDAPNGLDSPLPPPPPISWDGLGALVPVNPPDESQGPDKEDEDEDEDDNATTWHDVALSIAAELMDKVRKDVYKDLGYTLSAGIARNKFLAKLSASYRKPNTQSILRNAAIPNYLKPMAFQKIRFLGGKLGSLLAKEYDVSTVGDLLSISLDEMQRKFGENAIWIYEVLRGIDRSEVKEKSAVNKSMLASKNLQTPITRAADGYHWIRVLAAELALRLNDARRSNPGLWPKSIALHARQGYETSRSKQAAFPYVRDVTVDTIASAGDKLWKELVPSGPNVPMKVTAVQLSFGGLEGGETGQRSIETFFKHPGAPSSSSSKRSREDDDAGDNQDGPSHASNLLLPEEQTNNEDQPSVVSFVCKRCGQRIESRLRLAEEDVGAEDRTACLAKLRAEHDDFHFARELARAPDSSSSASNRAPQHPARKKKKKAQEPKGIAKFFTPK